LLEIEEKNKIFFIVVAEDFVRMEWNGKEKKDASIDFNQVRPLEGSLNSIVKNQYLSISIDQ
jgi:hypothetical protein